jgi:hypothetical protein
MIRLRRLNLAALAALLVSVSLQCGGEDINQPPDAAAVEMAGGNGQVAPVSAALPEPLVVEVVDANGDPVPGVTVQWTVQGGGDVSPASATTGSDGKSSATRTHGATAGQQLTLATVAGLEPVTFSSTATDGSTLTLAISAAPSPAAQSGVALAAQPVIQLKDGTGQDQAKAGVEVTASIGSGTGTLGGTVTRTTDNTGAATFTDLSITGSAGPYTLTFSAPGYVAVTSATVTLGAAAAGIAITTNPPTAALTSEVFDPAAQPAVQVNDAGGQPVPGVVVTAAVASGGGSLEGTTTATTDASGAARFGDLGIAGTGPQTLSFTAGGVSVTSSTVTLTALSPEATVGKWGPLIPWGIVPLHMSLLPTGKILAWGKYEPGSTVMGGMPRLWDPAAGPPTSARTVQVDTMLFCAGHAFMPDGRLMISGGHKDDSKGINRTNIFDPSTESFVPGLPNMAFGRWYPTVTELPDGRLLTMAGRDEAGAVVTTPEIWEGNKWVPLPGAGDLEIPFYPRNFIDPTNGLVFMAGERVQSRWFDVDGSVGGARGQWISGPTHIFKFNRDYGTAAMYEPGKILMAGGGGSVGWKTPDPKAGEPTATAEKIDLTSGNPTWQSAGSMSVPRRHLNSTILPDGKVLITGGTRGHGFVNIDPALAAKAAEEWDPATNQWTTLASNSIMRVYHSVSMLLPDATVLHGASGNATDGPAIVVPDELNHEIFSPPYLFKGARPTVADAPASVGYGETFAVATPNAAQITEVRWIHIGTVTHAFDFGQRANKLDFQRTATGVSVTAPTAPNLAPPGHYMLFILNRNGVPSTGRIIHIQ